MRYRTTTLATLTTAVLACSGPGEPPPSSRLTADRIDVLTLIVGIPLSKESVSLSGDGRKRVTWSVEGAGPLGRLEVIGNDPADADQVGLSCDEFDTADRRLPDNRPNSLCQQLYGKLLGHFVSDGPDLAGKLMTAAAVQQQGAYLNIGDFSFDTSPGFSFIRRKSRLK